MPAPTLITKRLKLRHWIPEDLEPFAKMNSDPKVLEFFVNTLTKSESDELAHKIEQELTEKDYGLWAVETIEEKKFIGFVGLHYQDFLAPFTPCIEIGWRLAYEAWGKGYAYEAASKVVDYAFDTLKLEEIVSFTSTLNKRSMKLMEKLGMTRNPEEDFDSFKVPEGHPLRRQVLYRMKRSK